MPGIFVSTADRIKEEISRENATDGVAGLSGVIASVVSGLNEQQKKAFAKGTMIGLAASQYSYDAAWKAHARDCLMFLQNAGTDLADMLEEKKVS